MVKLSKVKTFQAYLDSCERKYSCVHCRAHLASHDELLSKVRYIGLLLFYCSRTTGSWYHWIPVLFLLVFPRQPGTGLLIQLCVSPCPLKAALSGRSVWATGFTSVPTVISGWMWAAGRLRSASCWQGCTRWRIFTARAATPPWAGNT